MKLREACSIAENCGLETIAEAMDFVEIHASSLFPYDDITDELRELYKEFKDLPCWMITIEDLLSR